MARRNRDDRREKRAENKKKKTQNKIASRTADIMAKELIDVEKSNRKNPKKKIKENIDPETGLNLSSPSSQSTIQMAGDGKGTSSAPKKKKKKVTTVKGPVTTGSVDIPQKSTTTVDGKIVSEKIGDPTKVVSITPMPKQSAVDALGSGELLRPKWVYQGKGKPSLGDEIKKEISIKVDDGSATQGQFNQALEDASRADEEVEKEKKEIVTPISGDGKTVSGVMGAGGAPPASFLSTGNKEEIQKKITEDNKRNAKQDPSAETLNAAASAGAVEKLGLQDYYPTAARNIAVGTFTGEVIGSQTIYSGAGGLAPMGLYDARKRALAKAATAKQAAIDKFLTLEDTAKAYNMEYKDYAYDHLYDILEKHGFNVSSVMRDRDAAKEVYRLKDLGKELKFIEEESKTILTTLGKEEKYVPKEIAEAAKRIFYGMEDKDKVFSGKTNLVKDISELKAYNSLTKKAEDLAKVQKLSEQAMTDNEMDNYKANGIMPVPSERGKEFEKERASFVRRIDNGDLAWGSDGYYTGVLKYFGGNVDQLFSSYTDVANYSDDQLDAAKKIFVNMVPSSVELSMQRYRTEEMNLLNYRLRKEGFEFDKSQAIKKNDGVIQLEADALTTVSQNITDMWEEGKEGIYMSEFDARRLIKSSINSLGGGLATEGREISGSSNYDAIYSSYSVPSEERSDVDFKNLSTTVSIDGKLQPMTMAEIIVVAKSNPNIKVKVGDQLQALTSTDIEAMSNVSQGGKTGSDAVGSYRTNTVNSALSYVDNSGVIKMITPKNLRLYAGSEKKVQLRNFTGNVTINRVVKEETYALGQDAMVVGAGKSVETDKERAYTVPGDWSTPQVKASTGTNEADNKILLKQPGIKYNASAKVGFSTFNQGTENTLDPNISE